MNKLTRDPAVSLSALVRQFRYYFSYIEYWYQSLLDKCGAVLPQNWGQIRIAPAHPRDLRYLRNKPRQVLVQTTRLSESLHGLVAAIEKLTNVDWDRIYDATRDRLLSVEYNSEDTESNRVICEMTVFNALYDIRDYCMFK